MDKKISRRTVLLRAVQIPIGGSILLGLSACGSDGGSAMLCADPNRMTSAEESVRRTLRYTEVSPDPAKVCAGCDFFHAAPEGNGCGSCEMFSGGPVNPDGYCDSWSVDA
jgi:hypothetical protein